MAIAPLFMPTSRTALPLAALFLLAGCSQFMNQIENTVAPTPLTRVYQLRVDYTATMKVMVQARMLGKISDEQYVQIEATRKQAAAALDTLESMAASGQVLDAGLLNQAQTAVDALIASKSKYN